MAGAIVDWELADNLQRKRRLIVKTSLKRLKELANRGMLTPFGLAGNKNNRKYEIISKQYLKRRRVMNQLLDELISSIHVFRLVKLFEGTAINVENDDPEKRESWEVASEARNASL